MTKFNTGDFVEINFDIYANDKLVQTTDAKKGKEANLNSKKFETETIVLGKNFILKALDEAILKKDSGSLDLTADQAYGKRKKDLIKTFAKSAFDEQKLRPVVGATYDFNGMYGVVKSIVGGRITVDFNNPLSGKSIKVDYKVLKKVDDICDKISVILGNVLRVPKQLFKLSKKDKKIILEAPEQFVTMKEMLSNAFIEMIPEFKDYSLEVKVINLKVSEKKK